jgi:hypothetical protein
MLVTTSSRKNVFEAEKIDVIKGPKWAPIFEANSEKVTQIDVILTVSGASLYDIDSLLDSPIHRDKS